MIDGKGGKIGSLIIDSLKKATESDSYNIEIYAIGSNVLATSAMLKAGADYAATGENPVVVTSRVADIIVGPTGILVANSLLGEITPAMAVAVGDSKAYKILLPVNKCNTYIVGTVSLNISELVSKAVDEILEHVNCC